MCDPEPCAKKRWVASEVHSHDSDPYGIPGMMYSSESELDIGEGRHHQDEDSSDSESDGDAGFDNLLSAALHVGKPPAHFPDKECKLLASRGGGVDGSDDCMIAPPPALLLQDGDEQSMSVDMSDSPALLQQFAGKKSVRTASSMATHRDQDLLNDFVLPLL